MTREPIPNVIADCMLSGCQNRELRAEVERLASAHADKAELVIKLQDEVERLKAERNRAATLSSQLALDVAKHAVEVERLKAWHRHIARDPDTNVEAVAYARDALRGAPKP